MFENLFKSKKIPAELPVSSGAAVQFQDVFKVKKPIIGMLHLRGNGKANIFENAQIEIEQMYSAGVDAVVVEDYFGSADDVEIALAYLQKYYPDHIYGVNLLGDFEGSYAAAKKYGAAFMQADSVSGHLRTLQEKQFAEQVRQVRDGSVLVMGGVRFKYQPVHSGRSTADDLKIGMQRCDAIVVTGAGTGKHTDMDKIREFRSVIGDFPLIVGAGMTLETCQEQLAIADGAIVGSWFKERGHAKYPVSPERVAEFMQKVRELREKLS